MIKSMTGYGAADVKNEQMSVHVEIKTLNSKFFDPQIKSPKAVSSMEMEIRNILSERLLRGKITVSIELTFENGYPANLRCNTSLFKKYYGELKELAEQTGDPGNDIFRIVLQLPEVLMSNENATLVPEDWEVVKNVLLEAIDKCNEFRSQEGSALQEKLLGYIERINAILAEVVQLEKKRSDNIRHRLEKGMSYALEDAAVDKNRYEQEIIYYLEKLDITEEIVRLQSHLDYFKDVVDDPKPMGKKLGFIAQEIGREINTIGSKANDAEMQREVVQMKEELEKIKEQSLNIL